MRRFPDSAGRPQGLTGQRDAATPPARSTVRTVRSDDTVNMASGNRELLLVRLEKQDVCRVGRWLRDELYEEEA